MAIKLKTEYLSTNRGIIKIVQIVISLVLSFMICKHWEHGIYRGCYGDGRTGYIGSLNSIVLLLNIIWFILNLINTTNYKFERIYAIVCTILYFIALGLLIWYYVVEGHQAYDIVGMVLIGVMGGLFLWDVQILQGETSN
uniref:MARVEL domain-containing protein n=1 Tax=Acrobeloides nanus TaxID=290746 RepID=A0A914DEJ4_9BILA